MITDLLFEGIEKKVRDLAPEEFTKKHVRNHTHRGIDARNYEIPSFFTHCKSYVCQVGPFSVRVEESYEETELGFEGKPRYGLLVEERGEKIKDYPPTEKIKNLFQDIQQKVLAYEEMKGNEYLELLRKEKERERERKLAEAFPSV